MVLCYVHSDDLEENGIDFRQNAMKTLLGWETYGWAVAIWFQNGVAVQAPPNLTWEHVWAMFERQAI
jgi:hypothetical protein